MDPTFFEQLYRQEGRWDKYAWAYDAFSAQGAIICTASHDLHKARRQPLNRFFSKANVVARQDIIYRNVELRAELASAKLASSTIDGEMQIKTLEQLPYLTAVIMEGLRLSPAIGSRMARISPDRDIIYGDWRIPAGTPVVLHGLATVTQRFEFKFENVEAADFEMDSDQFIIGTKGKSILKAHVTPHQV
ncbi:hypothetical protein KJ359_000162 [Pestalotiopsis sp. 9143b]|nr:hypothetical protein KJ359_000162 [Pestalotiopsis sp. 9143b]